MIKSLQARIDRAVETAPEVARLGLPLIAKQSVSRLGKSGLLRYPEQDLRKRREPGLVAIAPDELPTLVDMLLERGIIPPRVTYLGRLLEHEADHEKVLWKLGAAAVWQGAELVRYGGVRAANYFSVPSGLRVSALAMAAALAHPLHNMERANGGPSMGDIWALYELGFTGGVQEVGQEIEMWNRAGNEPQLPLPRTYEPFSRGQL